MLRRVLVVSLALAMGCTLLTSLDGLSGDPEPALDAAADVVDAASIDASADHRAPPADAGDADADGGPHGCASLGTHTFCDDFDDTTVSVQDGWDLDNTGTIAPDTTLFVSPSRSVLFALPQDYPSCTFAQLQRTSLGSFHRAKLSASIRIGSAAGTDSVPLYIMGISVGTQCTVLFGPDALLKTAYIQTDPFGEGGTAYPLTTGVAPGTWKRVTALVDTTTSPNVVVTVDGTNVLYLTSFPVACQGTGSVKVRMGPHCARDAGALEVRMDDVTIDVE